MKRTRCFDFRLCPVSLKKRVTCIRLIKLFFRPVTFYRSGRFWFMGTGATGRKSEFGSAPSLLWPVALLFFAILGESNYNFPRCSLSYRIEHRSSCSLFSGRFCATSVPFFLFFLSGRFFYFRHFVKEYIVTLTNHIRRIEELAAQVIVLADSRDYPQAHLALDEISSRVHSARVHLDHLQDVQPKLIDSKKE